MKRLGLVSQVFIFHFVCLVPSAFAQGLRDVKSPLDLPSKHVLIFSLLGIIIAVLTICLVWYLIKRAQHIKQQQTIVKSSWDIAYERLDELKKKDLMAKGEVEEYYTNLSDIIRRYFEDHLKLHAPEMTTEEFLTSLNRETVLNVDQKETLKAFLMASDMVKFAKYTSSVDESKNCFEIAKRLIDETK